MAVVALVLPLLHACGGGGGSDGGGDGAVRLVNAADGYASLDLYANDTEVSTAVAGDSAGDYVTLGANTYTFKLKRAGSSTTASSAARTVSGNTSYSLLAYSSANSLRTVLLSETEEAPSAGAAKLRVFNGSIEAGSLDVYVTDAAASLDDSSPTSASVGTERVSSYNEVSAGTYRIRVTAAGDKSDVRLDLPSVALTDQQITTLVLTATPGGVLVHGLTMDQKGDVTARKNPSARVRLAAGADANGAVGARLNGVSLATGQRSPAVGLYVLVPAGTLTSTVTLDDNPVSLATTTLTAGSDNTLLVTGGAANAKATLIADDNRPPLDTSNAKLRLVNGVGSLANPLTLEADLTPIASEIAANGASDPVAIPSGTTTDLRVTTLGSVLFTATDVTLLAGRVYTVFMLGDANAPVGISRRDR